jgi:hypothetical protein
MRCKEAGAPERRRPDAGARRCAVVAEALRCAGRLWAVWSRAGEGETPGKLREADEGGSLRVACLALEAQEALEMLRVIAVFPTCSVFACAPRVECDGVADSGPTVVERARQCCGHLE